MTAALARFVAELIKRFGRASDYRGLPAVMLMCLSLPAASQVVSFTFDDGFDPRVQPMASSWNESLLRSLAAEGVVAALFPAGRVVDTPEGRALVRDWSRSGHAIGNHTYSHRSLGNPSMTLAAFTADVLAQQRIFENEPGWQKRLRFPYLKEGESADKRDGMRAWMVENGYRPAPVSIDTSDWFYDQRLQAREQQQPGFDASGLRDLYLKHLLDRAHYYDALAVKLLHRHPAHVMLLHTTALNARFFGDVVRRFRAEGWTIVGPMQAFDDPLYAMRPRALPAGESIVWALARDAGETGLRYPGEDDNYEKPMLDAAGF